MSGELVEHLFLPASAPRRATGSATARSCELGGGAARVLHRLLRRQADVLPRGQHRRPRRQRHRQRPGHVRARRRWCCPPRSSSRRAPRWPTSAGRRGDGRRGPAAGVRLVTGDTKVVDSGTATGSSSTPPASASSPDGVDIGPQRARVGDVVIVSGDLGVHGVAVMSAREGLEFGTAVRSDTAPLHGLVATMLATGADVHALRDPTRGGLAASLNEIARAAGVGVDLDERALPIPAAVARRVRPARPGPALRRQRGQAGRLRPGRGRRPGAGGHARPRAGARRGGHRHGRARSTREWWWPGPRSAAPGSSTCRSASSCPGSADVGGPADRAMYAPGAVLFARYAYPPNELGYCGPADAPGLLLGVSRDGTGFGGSGRARPRLRRRLGLPGDPRRGGRGRGPARSRGWWRRTGSATTCSRSWTGRGSSATSGPGSTPRSPAGGAAWRCPACPVTRARTTASTCSRSTRGWGCSAPDRRPRSGCWTSAASGPGGSSGSTATQWSCARDPCSGMAGRWLWARPGRSAPAGSTGGHALAPDLAPGQEVSLHWDWVCDVLHPAAGAALRHYTDAQLAATNAWLASGRTPGLRGA